MSKGTLGIVVVDRNFLPDDVARDGHAEILFVLHDEGFGTVRLARQETRFGTVDTFQDTKACAQIFRRNADKTEGVVVILPNFGDERGVANSIKLSGLKVPILAHAYPDSLTRFAIGSRSR